MEYIDEINNYIKQITNFERLEIKNQLKYEKKCKYNKFIKISKVLLYLYNCNISFLLEVNNYMKLLYNIKIILYIKDKYIIFLFDSIDSILFYNIKLKRLNHYSNNINKFYIKYLNNKFTNIKTNVTKIIKPNIKLFKNKTNKIYLKTFNNLKYYDYNKNIIGRIIKYENIETIYYNNYNNKIYYMKLNQTKIIGMQNITNYKFVIL